MISMTDTVIVQLNPVNPPIVYVVTDCSEEVPLVYPTTMDQLLNVITAQAKRYNIKNIQLVGGIDYVEGIKQQVLTHFNLCFGKKADEYVITVHSVGERR